MINMNLTPEERHIRSLNNNGARIKAPDGTTEPVSMDFYRRAVEQCRAGGYNAVTYELELSGIDGDFQSPSGRTGMWTAVPHAESSTASHPVDTAHTAATERLNGLSLAVHPS